MQGEVLWAIHWGGNAVSLWAAARLMGLYAGRRLAAAAALGACGALLMPGPPALLLLPPAMARLAFGSLAPRQLLRAWVIITLCGGLLAGLCALCRGLGAAEGWALCGAGLLTAFASPLLKPPPPSPCQRVLIQRGGRRLVLSAMVDTGNLLTDPLTQLPVIVCSKRALAPLGLEEADLRSLTVRTCAGRGRMPMFRPQAVSLRVGGRWQSCRAMIAAAPKGYDGMQALVPAQLIQ